jgi:hypothetical protein
MVKLRYLVLLSLAIEHKFLYGDKERLVNYRDFIFIMKKADATIDDKNYIAYFNHKEIKSAGSPYSGRDKAPASKNRAFKRIVLTGPYSKDEMHWSGSFSTRWKEHSSFIPFYVGMKVRFKISQFFFYKEYIKFFGR